MTLIVMATTCLYVAYSFLQQARVITHARDDFAWWMLFTHLEKSPNDFDVLRNPKHYTNSVTYFDYFDEIGICLMKQQDTLMTAEISSKTFNMGIIEPSFYAKVDDMPFWIRKLDLLHYEPTALTDAVFALVSYVRSKDHQPATTNDLLPQKFGMEALKRSKKLRSEAQYFEIEMTLTNTSPQIYRKIEKKFQSQKIKVPAIELDFRALQAVWIIAVIATVVSITIRNQISFLKNHGISDINEPWLIFDADSFNSRFLALLWMAAFCLSPFIIFGTLTSLQYASAWINGPTSTLSTDVTAGLLIAFLATISALETLNSLRLILHLRSVNQRANRASEEASLSGAVNEKYDGAGTLLP